MLSVKIVANVAVSATTEFPADYTSHENRNDWKSMERAEEVAAQLNAAAGFRRYIATDAGGNVYPRYDVIVCPAIGDEVSKTFNGDYYPEGTIAKISASLKRIETTTGAVFTRKRATGQWIQHRTWALVAGVHNDMNPSF